MSADTKKFNVSITHNVKRDISYIPKPILDKIDNPKGLGFARQDYKILLVCHG